MFSSISLATTALLATFHTLASASLVQNCSQDPAIKFPNDFSNWKCPGLEKPPHLRSYDLEGCAEACCEQPDCEIYQYCAVGSLCAQTWGPTCVIGKFGDDGAEACVPDAGWQSRSRSGSALPSCHDDEDCNLNGVCGSGECRCNPGWTGADCGQLDLVPIKLVPIPHQQSQANHPLHRKTHELPVAYGRIPNASTKGLSSWGGSVLKDPHNPNLFHLFAAEMSGECGLSAWGRNSVIIHATSETPEGPYSRKDEILSFFAHEPTVVALPASQGGGYVMYKIGCADGAVTGSNATHPPSPGPCTACTNGSTTGKCPPVDPSYERTCQDALFAESLDGPWSRHNLSLGFPVWGNQNIGLESVGPVVLDNGTVLTFTRAWHPGNTGGHGPFSSISLLRADSWNGTYEVVNGSMGWCLEDSFMFRDKSGHFHALFHAFSRDVGGHVYSRDGIHWTLASTAAYEIGFITTATSDTGEVQVKRAVMGRRERPHLLMDESMNPTHLITGLTGGLLYPSKSDLSVTFVQAIKSG